MDGMSNVALKHEVFITEVAGGRATARCKDLELVKLAKRKKYHSIYYVC
jgi:hypothetical protein